MRRQAHHHRARRAPNPELKRKARMELVIFIIWFVLAITVGVAAYSRGRGPFSWFVFSVLFSPLLGVLFLMAFKPIERASRQPRQPRRQESPALAKFRRGEYQTKPVSGAALVTWQLPAMRLRWPVASDIDARLRGWLAAAFVLGVIVVALVISNAAHAQALDPSAIRCRCLHRRQDVMRFPTMASSMSASGLTAPSSGQSRSERSSTSSAPGMTPHRR